MELWVVRPLTAADLPLVRVWMQDARADDSSDAPPVWTDADLALVVDSGQPKSGRERRGWAAIDARGGLAAFMVATALRIAAGAPECELEFLYVLPRLRRSGAGRALLQTLIAWADELEASELWLEVRSSNAAAQRLYASCGFQQVGVRRGYYLDPPDDAVMMRRQRGHAGPRANV